MLFSSRSDPLVPSILPDITMLQDLIRSEINLNNNVVLICHSFGGAVTFGALTPDLLPNPSESRTGLVGVIGLTTIVPPVSNVAIADLGAPPWYDTSRVEETGRLEVKGDKAEIFYNDLDREEAARWVEELSFFSYGAVRSAEGVSDGWREVVHGDEEKGLKVWYLVCGDDQAIPVDAQEMFVGLLRGGEGDGQSVRKGRVTSRKLEGCGHSPFLSRVDETVGFIVDAVEDFERPWLNRSEGIFPVG